MTAPRTCPAFLLAAPASGQGKTTLTVALARYYRHRGRRVRVFKTGPDFLDPMILERVTGTPVYQLDLWMVGEDHCRALLYEAAGESDLILIEGVMGLYDGAPGATSADLAARFGIPVVAVIDAAAMAQTFGAVAQGLARYREDLVFAGVFANHVAGGRHAEMLSESLPRGLRLLGWLPHAAEIALPERHLGLTQAAEIADLEARLERAAGALVIHEEALRDTTVEFRPPRPSPRLPPRAAAAPLAGQRLACARDAAFAFLYPANLDVLRALGAELHFFSPLADAILPEADALYLPGGYPELHLARLASNESMKQAIRRHHAAGKPILAECGGMLYLAESLTDQRGNSAPLVGLIPGRAVMQERLANLGLHTMPLPEGELRGHTFHYSRLESALTPAAWSEPLGGGARREPLYRLDRLTATYVHLYFPSNPAAVAALFAPSPRCALSPTQGGVGVGVTA